MTEVAAAHRPAPARECVYVVGHKNPDTDAVSSAIGYAWLLREQGSAEAIAARAGSLNPQTRFALETFGLSPPLLLEDAAPRFESIVNRIEPLTPDTPLSAAWQLSAKRTALRRSSSQTARRSGWSPASRSSIISRSAWT